MGKQNQSLDIIKDNCDAFKTIIIESFNHLNNDTFTNLAEILAEVLLGNRLYPVSLV